MQIYDVKINGHKNPVGYDFRSVVCSWKVRDARGTNQISAMIEVAEESDFQKIIYYKEGENLNSLGELLEIELKPYTRYYYRIQVISDEKDSAVSDIHWFETAKMKDPWAASWITMKENEEFHPVFRKKFKVLKKIKNARIYVSGLGLFEAWNNRKKVGEELLAPFINDYREHIQYCTYDIHPLLAEENEIQILLGNGWYKGEFGLELSSFGKDFLCIAEIRITYEDNTIEVIGTDTTWEYQESMIEHSGIYYGEEQNYLLHEGKDNPWKSAALGTIEVPLTERYSPRVHEMEKFPIKEVIHTPAGELVLDFGQNFAGYVQCTQSLEKGTKMRLEFGEILQNGNFYHDNYRTAKSIFSYISDGKDRTIRPHFTFFGFRYVKVSGVKVVELECFTGIAVYSELEQTGSIRTSNKKVNRLVENVFWGLKSNFLDMPTDCPQRDERLGWTGDAQVFCRTAGYCMDVRAFYQKFLRDLRSDQMRNLGKVAVYFPNTAPGMTSSVWSDIATFMPKMLYDYYGDKTALSQNYPLMRDWVDSVDREDGKRENKHYLWDFGFHFGDWLALDGSTEQSRFGRTDSTFIASAYYYASASYVADAAKILENGEEQKYRTLAKQIYQAILNEFFSPTGRLTIDTQTGYIVALGFGIWIQKEKLIEALKKRLKGDCYRIKGGFVGATMMNTVLAENGLSELAYDLLLYEGFPGWLYAVNLGATTIWERWNSVLSDGKLSGTDMNSLNHYSYGAVAEFLYRHAAGIIPEAPGFVKVRLEPKPDARFGFFECSYDSAAGKYVSNWKINSDGTLSLHFEVPFGAEAQIILPDSDRDPIDVGAGRYDFTYMPTKDYQFIQGGNTRLEILASIPEALKVLNTYAPQCAAAIDKQDIEELAKTLNEKIIASATLGWPTKQFEKAVEELGKIKIREEQCDE